MEMLPEEVSHFVHLMLDAQDKGCLTSNTFTKKKFDEIAKELYSRFPNKRPFSEPEQWAQWIQENSKFKKFREQGVMHYEEMSKLFKQITASGDWRRDTSHVPADSDEERQQEQQFCSTSLNRSGHMGADVAAFGAGRVLEVGGSSRKSGKGKRTMDSGVSEGGLSKKSREEMQDAAVLKWYAKQQQKEDDKETLVQCMAILKSMQITDHKLYVQATEYLKDPQNCQIFLLSDSEFRLSLILDL
ncbi:OLC1v1030593C1 [Oldenlandia corymbosa var. corymbosa]|uniref:OLC1v1030593C1 n=1 Tax=Oldenlandia corymbosa var. corymbosa TaxID=529605 RepID=A0AAV1CJD6_OLDCO|nr:OLC1v1030593C1 [Oldenlandia corymbosa var. corymbosa]